MALTALTLSIGGMTPLCAEECMEILAPLCLGQTKRTINGDLIFLGEEEIKKYACVIKGKGRMPPALEGLKRGKKVKVGCLSWLTQKFMGDGRTKEVSLEKEPVSQSVVAYTETQEHWTIGQHEHRKMVFNTPPPLGTTVFITYRPHLWMMVLELGFETHEWDLHCQWFLKMEEV